MKKKLSTICGFIERHSIIVCVILGIIENFVIEALSRRSIPEAFSHLVTSPTVFFYNSLIIIFTLSLCLLFRRRIFGIFLFSLPWLLCGLINNAVLSYRVTPLGAIDFQVVKMSLILVYLTKVQRIMLYVAAGLVVVLVVVLWIVGPKISGKLNFGRNIATIVGLLAAVLVATNLGLSYHTLSNRFGDIVGAYKDYGFAYCFSSSVLDSGIDKPSGYSEAMVRAVTDTLRPAEEPVGEEELPDELSEELPDETLKPNIIMIQLESFLDPNLINGAKFDENPVPVFTYLKENYTSGELHMPSYGGGTANSEFEVLTGMSMEPFGSGEYPYKTIMLEVPCESIAFNLKELGYGAHAIHNHTGNFYDRDKVYPNMGFDSFSSIEYMDNIERTSFNWCKDKILTGEILKAIDTDTEHESKFVWAVSVQGHGKYPEEPIEDLELAVHMKRGIFTDERTSQIEYYSNMISEMDTFVGDLISQLEERGEPTVLVLYGDHLPSLEFTTEEMGLGDVYTTEYVIWDNIGLEKQPRRRLEANLLSSYVTGLLGFNNGTINRFNQLHQTDADYEQKLELLQYDALYGNHYGWPTPDYYQRSDMRMGTVPITIDYVTLVGDNLYVSGSGFTEKSRIFINGDQKTKTQRLSSTCVTLSKVNLDKGDVISVGQASSKREILSYTNEIIYGAQPVAVQEPAEDSMDEAELAMDEETEAE
ncbi:MAG: LTA synthase family protein [Oscillospiraceae bacterium]|nr:LTA synthase family protein [Oscillospiraceae bacterium]